MLRELINENLWLGRNGKAVVDPSSQDRWKVRCPGGHR
jgi:hypothetical protein